MDVEKSYLAEMIGQDKLVTVFHQDSHNEKDSKWHNSEYSFKQEW